MEWGVWGVLGHKGGNLKNEISALIKEASESSLVLLPHEDTKKMSVYEPGNGASSHKAHTWIVDFSASRTMTKKFPLFINHSVHSILLL